MSIDVSIDVTVCWQACQHHAQHDARDGIVAGNHRIDDRHRDIAEGRPSHQHAPR